MCQWVVQKRKLNAVEPWMVPVWRAETGCEGVVLFLQEGERNKRWPEWSTLCSCLVTEPTK